MNPISMHREACHNCRRRRLKCDRSLPQCLKCAKTGQDCLGYGRLLRWEQGVASRGKMAGVTSDDMRKELTVRVRSTSQSKRTDDLLKQQTPDALTEVALPRWLAEPSMQDLDSLSRKYLHYFASNVCRDLVLYDVPNHNPFRELIPLAYRYPILLQTIVANSALHMTNAYHRSSNIREPIPSDGFAMSLPNSPSSITSSTLQPEFYHHALAAKQHALHLLKLALMDMVSADVDVTLAVVLLFIEFELLDSGRDNWKFHVNGARTIIERLCGIDLANETVMSPLRKWLVSNCLVFDLLGSSLASSNYLPLRKQLSSASISLLQDSEGNHCSSFPAVLLPVIQSGAQLLNIENREPPGGAAGLVEQQEALYLLQMAQSFDPISWATDLQQRSPAPDLLHRIQVASAHQIAVCIYLSRVILSLWPDIELPLDPDVLAQKIIVHLSHIRPTDALFTATAWPAFIAGVDTDSLTIRTWVIGRFQDLWDVEPWGLTKEALGVLSMMWETDENGFEENNNTYLTNERKQNRDWIRKLKRIGVDWLIA